MKNSEKCLICGKTDFKNSNSFTKHIRIHKLESKEYYDKFINTGNEEFCKCGNKIAYSSIDNGYSKQCTKCSSRDPNRTDKIRKTFLERYGVRNASQVEEFKQKRENTNLERYGVKHAMSNPKIMQRCLDTWTENYEEGHPGRDPEIKEQKKNTCIEKYGVENPSQVEEFKEKRVDTMIERYGVEYAMSNPDICKLSQDKMEEKYGVRHALCKSEFLEKARQTNLQNRGVEWPMKDEIVLAKAQETNLRKLGVSWPMQNEKVKESVTGQNNPNWNANREEVSMPYSKEFFDKTYRDQIKREQDYIDPITEKQLVNRCCLHHIDYNKDNCSRENLIWLNLPIHIKTNSNREEWKSLLQKINSEIISRVSI